VDIEISRWNCEENADVQFLVQPPGSPQTHRFFSGATNATLDQGGHNYSFNWLPGRIEWGTSAGGGETFALSTEELLYKRQPDLIQCMPDQDVEVRINLWNMLGAKQPEGLSDTDYVEVRIGRFSYEPSSELGLGAGEICSKDCQCSSYSCVDHRCA
jgi:hypothetical protein